MMTAATTAIITGRLLSKCLQRYLWFAWPAGRIQRYNNGDSSANTGKYIALVSRYHWATGLAQG